jgi:DNA-3-methyladenine glycosylase II
MAYTKHLKKDKVLSKIIVQELPSLQKEKNIALKLISSIMSQQLSTKVAKVIYQRFLALFQTKNPTPEMVLTLSHEQLRSIGLSNAKAIYVKNVAQFFIDIKLTDAKLHKLSNEEVTKLLIKIKGVGKWTIEMLLMFALCREDVFSIDDYGIQQAMIKLYKLPTADKKAMRQKMLTLSEKWSPYRTYACLHLWQWKDT